MEAISTALTSIKTSIDLAKFIKDGFSTLADAEQRLKVADLINTLAELKIEMANIQSALSEKDALITKLRKELKTKKSVVFDSQCYWLTTANGREGPFCQRCFDADDNKLVRLQVSGGGWHCLNCDNFYNTSSCGFEGGGCY